nr:alpha/beta hydrolase [Desulfobulbaceae bacterium]
QHGWGFNRDCFKGWLSQLQGSDLTFLDRGYWGNENAFPQILHSGYNVLVCHSLGLHFFTKDQLNSVDMIVVLGGFVCFHGHNPANQISRKHINRMQVRLQREPDQLLKDFYRDCSWYGEVPDIALLNLDLLAADLDLLDTVCLQYEPLRDVKVLILHGSNDRIVPVDRADELQKKLTGTLFQINGAGHGLPFTHVQQCLEIIRDKLCGSQID